MSGIKQLLHNENITNNKINNKTFHKQHIKYIQQKLTEKWERENFTVIL